MGFEESYFEPITVHPTAAIVAAPPPPKKLKTVEVGIQTERAFVKDELGGLQPACVPLGETGTVNVAQALMFLSVRSLPMVVAENVLQRVAKSQVDLSGVIREQAVVID
ncbi:unnamed protein product [Agarophyton chilense]